MNSKERYNKIQAELKRLVALKTDLNLNSDKVTIQLAVQGTSYELKDGSKICIEGDSLEVGKNVYGMDDDGNQTTINDGSYDLKNGQGITVKGGKLTAVNDQSTSADEKSPEAEETQDVTNKKPEMKASKKEVKASIVPNAGKDAGGKEEDDAISEDAEPMAEDDGTEPSDTDSRLEAIEECIQQILSILTQSAEAEVEQKKVEMSKPAVKPAVKRKVPMTNIEAQKEHMRSLQQRASKPYSEDIKSLVRLMEMKKSGGNYKAPVTQTQNTNTKFNAEPTLALPVKTSSFKLGGLSFGKGL